MNCVNTLKCFNPSEKALEKFDVFCGYLIDRNRDFNITAIKTPEEVYVKHFEDCLSGARFFREGEKIIEIGSGGGFPSVPLKIINEKLDFTLVEANGKKCEFLNGVKALLAFDNFDVINARSEELACGKMREAFDCVTARAVAPLPALCELTLPFLRVGGTAVFYKGAAPNEELISAHNAGHILGAKVKEIFSYELSGGAGKRNIVVFEKIAPTPAAYPRKYAKILKKPL